MSNHHLAPRSNLASLTDRRGRARKEPGPYLGGRRERHTPNSRVGDDVWPPCALGSSKVIPWSRGTQLCPLTECGDNLAVPRGTHLPPEGLTCPHRLCPLFPAASSHLPPALRWAKERLWSPRFWMVPRQEYWPVRAGLAPGTGCSQCLV